MNLELYIDRIEQYESGTMPESGRLEFENELATNAELREALAVYRQGNEVIEQGIENQLRVQLEQWAAADAGSNVSGGGRVVQMRNTWLRWAVAAGVAVLIGWLGMQWAGSRFSDQALYAAHYEKPADTAFRSGATAENPLEPGFKALEKNELQIALAFFRSIPPENERFGEAQYYLGHTALQLQQYQTAINAFQAVTAGQDFKLQEKAEWNLLLTYMAAGRSADPDFVRLLNRIAATPTHSFSQQAQDLKAALDSVWRKIL